MVDVPHKMLSIFVGQGDLWKDRKLSDAIVFALEKHGVSGVTLIEGAMGFGVHRRVHRKGLFGVSDEKPVMIMAVDEEERLRSVLPKLGELIKEGLVMMQDVEVIFESKRKASASG